MWAGVGARSEWAMMLCSPVDSYSHYLVSYFKLIVSFFLPVPCGMRDLSSLPGIEPSTPRTGKVES